MIRKLYICLCNYFFLHLTPWVDNALAITYSIIYKYVTGSNSGNSKIKNNSFIGNVDPTNRMESDRIAICNSFIRFIKDYNWESLTQSQSNQTL